MSLAFGGEKRQMLAVFAALAPLPLPFNEVLGWGWYLLYAGLAGVYVARVRGGATRWLPGWASNLLAVAYLPFLAFDLVALSGGHAVGPVVRLGLFAVTVKLWSLVRERDKWQAVIGIFFLFLAAAATSVHLSVVVYLVAILGLGLALLARFALLHLLAGFGHRDAAAVRAPLAGFLAVSALAVVALAVPLFTVLPRVNTPYIRSGVFPGGGGEVGISGFSDEVTLDSIGLVRTSREVALRLSYEGIEPPPELRLKGAAFDRFDGRRWTAAGHGVEHHGRRGAVLDLAAAGTPRGWVDIWRQPLGAHGLPLPVETMRVEVPSRSLRLDDGGALRAGVMPRQTLRYRAGVGARPRSLAPPPVDEAAAPTLDLAGVTPRMAELAARVAGEGDAASRAEGIERHLIAEYGYSLDLVGATSASPLDDFLFVHRRGHCEYFASAMVMLLRSQGIHARLVAGFLGGEETPLGYHLVRQGNAHAWVEAYLPGEGWRFYDPTPPAGRPAVGGESLYELASQLYDTMVFQWDRYVLTYGVEDQSQLILSGLQGLWNLIRRLRGDEGGAAGDELAAAVDGGAAAAAAGVPEARGDLERRLLTALLFALAVASAVLLWRRYRRPLTATRAYGELRRHLAGRGLAVTDSLAPLALERRAAGRFPAAAAPAGRVIDLYLRESFAGEELGETERGRLADALAETRAALRRAG